MGLNKGSYMVLLTEICIIASAGWMLCMSWLWLFDFMMNTKFISAAVKESKIWYMYIVVVMISAVMCGPISLSMGIIKVVLIRWKHSL